MDDATAWAAVADERLALADLLGAVAADDPRWDAPSLCGTWRVRDVVAHLMWLAEASHRSMFRDGLRVRAITFNRAVDRMALRVAATVPPDELVARLRAGAGGRYTAPTLPPTVALGEVVVHRVDIAAAVGLPAHAPDERVQAVLEAERRLWFAFGVPRSIRRLRFVPTDVDWTVGPADGPLVEGPGEQLLLAATGRQPALATLTGPGLAVLRSH